MKTTKQTIDSLTTQQLAIAAKEITEWNETSVLCQNGKVKGLANIFVKNGWAEDTTEAVFVVKMLIYTAVAKRFANMILTKKQD